MTQKKKKILIFIDWFLPGYKAGGPVQSCAGLIEHLKSDFDFSVVTRNHDYHEDQPYVEIALDVWIENIEGFRIFYFSENSLSVSSIFRILKNTEYDFIYVNGMFSFYFSLIPVLISRKSKVVLAVRGMLSPGALSVRAFKKVVFLSLSKLFGFYKKVVFQVSTPAEENYVKKYFPKSIIRIAGNIPRTLIPDINPKPVKKPGTLKLINIARISPEKNLLFALNLLTQCKFNVTLDIFGTVNDVLYWEKCKKVIDAMPENIHCEYKGAINTELIQHKLKEAHFLFMPSAGENFGHSIYESLHAGCPVIISDQTPWRNLESVFAGWDISLLNP